MSRSELGSTADAETRNLVCGAKTSFRRETLISVGLVTIKEQLMLSTTPVSADHSNKSRESRGARSVILVENVRKRYGAFELSINSLDVPEGQSLAIIGPSGSGKSTLLRLIAGLESPDAGRVTTFGVPARKYFGKQRRIRTVFQDLALFPHLSVEQQLALSLAAAGGENHSKSDHVVQMISMLDLKEKHQSRPHELSGGQRQRLALGRALIARPKALLMDEPMTALDYGRRIELWKYVDYLAVRSSLTFIVVTHDPDVALARSNKIAVISKGECLRFGSPQDLYADPGDEIVSRLLGAANIIELHGDKVQVEPSEIELSAERIEGMDYAFEGQLLRTEFRGTSIDLHVLVGGQVLRVRRPNDDSISRFAAKSIAFGGGRIHVSWNRSSVKNLRTGEQE